MDTAPTPFVRRPRPRDLPLRIARVLLAMWLIVGPFLLGFGGTFPQRQDTVAGLVLLGLTALGLFVPGTRVALILAGAWLIASPRMSFEYSFVPIAYWHDSIAGLACFFLGLLPLWRSKPESDVVLQRREPAPETETSPRRWRFWRPRRSLTP
jgi:hypothetical protein